MLFGVVCYNYCLILLLNIFIVVTGPAYGRQPKARTAEYPTTDLKLRKSAGWRMKSHAEGRTGGGDINHQNYYRLPSGAASVSNVGHNLNKVIKYGTLDDRTNINIIVINMINYCY